MAANRNLEWDGVHNARDLGGLRTADGRETRWGAVVRSEDTAYLTAEGWSALWAHGIRTVVDLTEDDEPDTAPRPRELITVHRPLEDLSDTEFWNRWGGSLSCTPLYYPAFLNRFPRRTADAVASIANARPGGVLVHCCGGRDRTGLVVGVLLALVGVSHDDIAADHSISHERLRPRFAEDGLPDDAPRIQQLLAEHGTTTVEVIHTALSRDLDAYLRGGGVIDDELTALRKRLLN